MKTIILTFLTAATIALTGCAADPSSPESPDSTDQASVAGERASAAFEREVSIGGRAGVVLANAPERRMYDFEATPRLGQRSPYEVSLEEIAALGRAVPHAASTDGTDVERRQEANVGVSGPKP